MEKLNLWFKKHARNVHYVGIGDGVHDGLYGQGKTLAEACVNFMKKLNKDKQYGIVDIQVMKAEEKRLQKEIDNGEGGGFGG